MYKIVPKKSFNNDFSKLSARGLAEEELDKKLRVVFLLMINDDRIALGKMPYRAHKLKGKYKDCFDLHIAGDIVLIYSYDEDNKIIDLLRIGSHNQVFNR